MKELLKLLKTRLGQIGTTATEMHETAMALGGLRSKTENEFKRLMDAIDDAKLLSAKALVETRRTKGILPQIADAEFKVFSQFGDDGIIQYLVDILELSPASFVEFGVGDYREANTRCLLLNNNWRGLVMEGREAAVRSIRQDPICWRHDLTAIHAFVDRSNINELLDEQGFSGELGLLHIDIDGNDYWVWDAVTTCSPVLVIIEYNSVFGPEHAVTVPYAADFFRGSAHYSNLYYGASLPALCHLAEVKGYAFVGSNSAGNNAYFVRKDRLGPLAPLSAREGYVDARFSESRTVKGEFAFLRGDDRIREIADMPLYDVIESQTKMAHEVFGYRCA